MKAKKVYSMSFDRGGPCTRRVLTVLQIQVESNNKSSQPAFIALPQKVIVSSIFKRLDIKEIFPGFVFLENGGQERETQKTSNPWKKS